MRLTVLSNGHGEDAIGARLLSELRRRDPEIELRAFPLVGSGKSYASAGFSTSATLREFPAGGLTFHSLALLRADISAGIIPHTVSQLRELAQLETDAVVSVGDILIQLLARLVRVRPTNRFAIQTLVSSHLSKGSVTAPHRVFMERITLFERVLLRGNRRVFVRDGATKEWLVRNSVRQTVFPGSLLLDSESAPREEGAPRVVLLPGSRAWAARSLAVMLAAAGRAGSYRYSLPWVGSELKLPAGWTRSGDVMTGFGVTVELTSGPLTDVLSGASAAIGTSGTGNEEAAASGLPVITFEVADHHTGAFIMNQQKLLGEALRKVAATPEAIAGTLHEMVADPALHLRLRATARDRFGEPGGIARTAGEILSQLGRGTGQQEPR